MATNISSPGGLPKVVLPVPPPPLHTRSVNGQERPQTPTQHGFTSPSQTPQGSPSKNRQPPGSNNLPDVFEHSLKLQPTPGSGQAKPSKQNSTPSSPRGGINIAEDGYLGIDQTMGYADSRQAPGSPTRKSNKENTPPNGKPLKEYLHQQNYAAASRQELYSPKEQGPTARRGYEAQRGLSAEDLEKLQKPQVKRLANVTQLCKLNTVFNRDTLTDF
jgi:cell cycle protein kinase DBF2